MSGKSVATAILVMMLSIGSTAAAAATSDGDEQNANNRFVKARIVEVTDLHVSIIAATGVEHVVALNDKNTTVLLNGKRVSIRDLREGDVVSIVLDERNPVMFAKTIDLQPGTNMVADARRH